MYRRMASHEPNLDAKCRQRSELRGKRRHRRLRERMTSRMRSKRRMTSRVTTTINSPIRTRKHGKRMSGRGLSPQEVTLRIPMNTIHLIIRGRWMTQCGRAVFSRTRARDVAFMVIRFANATSTTGSRILFAFRSRRIWKMIST